MLLKMEPRPFYDFIMNLRDYRAAKIFFRWPKWVHLFIWLSLAFSIFIAQYYILPDKWMTSFYVLPLLYGVLFLKPWADILLILGCEVAVIWINWEHFGKSSIAALSVPVVLGFTAFICRQLQTMIHREKKLHQEREHLNEQLIYAFAKTIEYKDIYTMGHSMRVAKYAVVIARKLHLPPTKVGRIYIAGLLHDIGKIGICEGILQKPGALTNEERLKIQQHVDLGVRILQGITGFEDVTEMVADHHERWDGLGYPKGKNESNINLGGRILAVSDVFDAMTTHRVYREPATKAEALKELIRCSGSQFDPNIVSAFIQQMRDESSKVNKSKKVDRSKAIKVQ